jgi:hypothetical protein
MNSLPFSWSALRQFAWAGINALPATTLDAHQLRLAADALAQMWRPLPGGLPPTPAETQPTVDSTGEHLLRQCLRTKHYSLLHKYYAVLAARGYRLPTSLLPAVLAHEAASMLGPDEHLTQVLGARGRWLAQHQPAWQGLLTQPTEQSWATDSGWLRLRFLRAYRRAAPDQARAFLAAHLAQVPTSEQAVLLRELAQHLGPADEPLLTQYLRSDDVAVRQAAGPLLASIPGNWLVEQLWGYAHPLLALRTASTGEVALHVTLPQTWPAGWHDVGIEPSHYGLEGPLSWVEQLLALIPPQRWTEQWQLTPRQLVQLAAPLESGPTLFKAWAAAASLHQHLEWASALVEAELGGFPLPDRTDLVYSPVHVLPPPAAEALLAYVPAMARLRDKAAPWQRVLLAIARPWPEAVLKRVLQLVDDSLQERSHDNFRIIRQLMVRGLVRATAPTHYELVEKRLSDLYQARRHQHSLLDQALMQVQLLRQVTQWLAALPPVKKA